MDLLAPPEEPAYEFYLYVTGATPNSTRAVRNMKEICEQYVAGQYTLRVIDMYQQPELAQAAQIVAAPTLVRRRPLPQRRLVGDLSNRAAVLTLLGLAHPLPPTA
ncbi:circadian clock KaiB family protein [Hymenobacter sp. H14-R3]|uniref:circadian clock KaiB family protein n=1 Tax=Hymenobacter sp. H14-R3 TaxID=3046308 RepID=UPI0024B88BFD|nr:circadian clock KaiB family protein [Hymenobacter sp. H14-R3]MDJ0364626.1 circadian clock KaiB family protein [Hymenobacter sp. H14-R3]